MWFLNFSFLISHFSVRPLQAETKQLSNEGTRGGGGGGGWGPPLFGLNGYVPLDRVWFSGS